MQIERVISRIKKVKWNWGLVQMHPFVYGNLDTA
jgi:hypothetical protein